MDREALTPMLRKTWMPVCQRRMQFMCVGLLLGLTERFVYGSGAFFFFYLTRLLHPLYICQQISVRGASVIDYTQPCCFFCFASLWNVLSILHLYLHPRCSCHFHFQNLWFFWKESSRWTDLTVSTRRRPSATWQAMEYMYFTFDPAL